MACADGTRSVRLTLLNTVRGRALRRQYQDVRVLRRRRGALLPEPAMRFYGERGEGFRALAVALQWGFPVRAIRRI
jgi:hypothetical protein